MKDEIKQKLITAQNYMSKQNYEKAESFLLEIKDKTIFACYMLDDLYQEIGKNNEALNLEIECANKGNMKFIDILRTYYLAKYDLENAYKYTLMGVNKNDPYSIYYLACSFADGLMTEVDYQKAYDLFVRFLNITNKKKNNYINLSNRMKASSKLLALVENNTEIIGNSQERLQEVKDIEDKCTKDYYDYVFLKTQFDYVTKDIEATSYGGITLVKFENMNNPNYSFDEAKELQKYLTKEYHSQLKLLDYLEENYKKIDSYRLTREIIALYDAFNYLHQRGYDSENIICDNQLSIETTTKNFMKSFDFRGETLIEYIIADMNKDLMTIVKVLKHLVEIKYINITTNGRIYINGIF